ncbi:DUF1254 domain-containing protein [Luminiphilus sp.]|nr:DUF1254 domain-containing protein [Luminiphilus sp.]
MSEWPAKSVSPAAELYLWGFPTVSVHRTRLMLSSHHDTGTLRHIESLATPSDKAIVAINNDTLYSSGWYDLSHGDVVIDVPPMDKPNRYWNLMVVDAYTHVAYVSRRHHGVSGVSSRVTFDPKAEPLDDGETTIRLGTRTAWIIIRVLVESPDDLVQARALQQQFRVRPAPDHPHIRMEPAGRAAKIAESGAPFFTELSGYVAHSPPALWHPALSPAAKAILDDPSGLTDAELEAGIQEAEALIKSGRTTDTVFKNGWSTGRAAGGPGDDILKRAVGAKFGLGGHYAVENRSYMALSDSQRGALSGKHELCMTFDADNLPPCDAFWSLTAYGMDLYLVENEINRYSIGDRTPDLHHDDDGGLTVILSAQRPQRAGNWLPVPDGPYMLGMRVYEGHSSVLDCHWFPPALTR